MERYYDIKMEIIGMTGLLIFKSSTVFETLNVSNTKAIEELCCIFLNIAFHISGSGASDLYKY